MAIDTVQLSQTDGQLLGQALQISAPTAIQHSQVAKQLLVGKAFQVLAIAAVQLGEWTRDARVLAGT
jgi:hypothetical protein